MPTMWLYGSNLPKQVADISRLRCPALSSVTVHFLARRPRHTLRLPLTPPPAAGKLVAMVGMTVSVAVAVEEACK